MTSKIVFGALREVAQSTAIPKHSQPTHRNAHRKPPKDLQDSYDERIAALSEAARAVELAYHALEVSPHREERPSLAKALHRAMRFFDEQRAQLSAARHSLEANSKQSSGNPHGNHVTAEQAVLLAEMIEESE